MADYDLINSMMFNRVRAPWLEDASRHVAACSGVDRSVSTPPEESWSMAAGTGVPWPSLHQSLQAYNDQGLL